jgi:hypothetical protein
MNRENQSCKASIYQSEAMIGTVIAEHEQRDSKTGSARA